MFAANCVMTRQDKEKRREEKRREGKRREEKRREEKGRVYQDKTWETTYLLNHGRASEGRKETSHDRQDNPHEPPSILTVATIVI
jgi:hypothetical protein